MNEPVPVLSRAERYRQAFDQSFAEDRLGATRTLAAFLAIRLEEAPYALRLGDVAGLLKGRQLMPLPSPLPELMGLIGFRGKLCPVYDLAALLGQGRARAATWIFLARGPELLGYAVDTFEGQLQADPAQVVAHQAGDAARPFLHDLLRQDGAARPILDLPALAGALRKRVKSLQKQDVEE